MSVSRSVVRPLIVATAGSFLAVATAAAQTVGSIEAAGDVSPVRIGTYHTTWHVARVAAGLREDGRFGWTIGSDRHRRGDDANWAVHTSGFRHLGEWTVGGTLSASPRATFLYRRSVEGEIGRHIARGFVLHGAYRHLSFRTATVHIAQPAASWYFSRGDIQARGFLVRNTSSDQQAATVLLRGSLNVAPGLRLTAGSALGNRIFDVAAIREARADAWVAFGSASVDIGRNLTLTIGAGGAHEEPLFSQRTMTVGVRWAFR